MKVCVCDWFLGGCFGLDLPLGFGVAVSLGWVGCNVVGLDLWLLLSCIGVFGFGLSFRCGLIAGVDLSMLWVTLIDGS